MIFTSRFTPAIAPIAAAMISSWIPVVDEAIVRKLEPVIRAQVAKGGIRLARLLDEALDPAFAPPPEPKRARRG